MKLEEKLTAAGISEAVKKFVTSEERNNKKLNSEGLEIGNKITIEGISETVSTWTNPNGELVEWIDVLTSGDKSSLSIARLVGTEKRNKYFAADREGTELCEDFAERQNKILKLPQNEGDALLYVAENLIGKTYEVVAMAEHCGRNEDRTFFLFAEVEKA